MNSTIEIPLEDEKDKNEPPVNKTEDGKTEDDTKNDSHEDDSDIPEDVLNGNTKNVDTQ